MRPKALCIPGFLKLFVKFSRVLFGYLYFSSSLSEIFLGQAQMLPSQLELALPAQMIIYMLFILYLQPPILSLS